MESVRNRVETATAIVIPARGHVVDHTVAELLRRELAPQARIVRADDSGELPPAGLIRVGVAGESSTPVPASPPAHREWMYCRLDAVGGGALVASKPHLLYTLVCRLLDEWLPLDASTFAPGKLLETRFRWLTGRDEFVTGRMDFVTKAGSSVDLIDIERAMQELARLGCSHVVVNELAHTFPYETGPEGEIYFRFYAYLPDLDQFVETRLNHGTYPREYLLANLQGLQQQARLAHKYGLVPGLHVANPRSVPESLLQRYPFLRGARVDHPFRAFAPRYTLTLTHPAVRWHYAELIRGLLRAVPELGFMKTLLNDSGSGFEYTSSLYAGRNGGPYMIREWSSDAEVARAAAHNVIRYYRVLRDAAHETHADFRVIVGLKNIAEEAAVILDGMDDGIDLLTLSQRGDVPDDDWRDTQRRLVERGSYLFRDTAAKGSAYVLGVPSPWQSWERLRAMEDDGFERIDVDVDPPAMVPFDVNREVVRHFQAGQEEVDVVVEQAAVRWVGAAHAGALIAIWRSADEAVRRAPPPGLYGSLGFTWYRFWVRPLVPDIGAIPEREREYYQKFMLSIFNNPHNVDLSRDVMWQIHTTGQCREMMAQFDTEVGAVLDEAVGAATAAASAGNGSPARAVFVDARDRLLAYRCYCVTMRNICAWIAGVHGYLEAEDDGARAAGLSVVRDMVALELANTRDLLELWQTTAVDFMPIHTPGETMHEYGPNFGELLQKKIELTQRYGDRLPRIDPDYMWRLPPGDASLDPSEYLEY